LGGRLECKPSERSVEFSGSSNDVGFLDIDPKWSSVETLSEVATLPMG